MLYSIYIILGRIIKITWIVFLVIRVYNIEKNLKFQELRPESLISLIR